MKAEGLDAGIHGSARTLVLIDESSELVCKATAKRRLAITNADLEAN